MLAEEFRSILSVIYEYKGTCFIIGCLLVSMVIAKH